MINFYINLILNYLILFCSSVNERFYHISRRTIIYVPKAILKICCEYFKTCFMIRLKMFKGKQPEKKTDFY